MPIILSKARFASIKYLHFHFILRALLWIFKLLIPVPTFIFLVISLTCLSRVGLVFFFFFMSQACKNSFGNVGGEIRFLGSVLALIPY